VPLPAPVPRRILLLEWGGTPEVMDDEWLRHAMSISNEGLDPVSFEEFLKVVDASRPADSSNS
jgi:hypothetical protein